MDPVELRTDRLLLRPWAPADAPAALAACSDPEVQRWTTVPSPYTPEVARAWVEEVAPGMWASGTGAPFAVVDAATGVLLAAVGVQGIDSGRAEVGYWAAREARGHGVVTEAVGAVSRWAFEELGLQRLAWEAEVGNHPSRAVAEKCGFTVEGVRRRQMLHRGQLVDCWSGALLADDEVADRRPFGGSWREVEGDGLVLRRWQERDVDALVEGWTDPDTIRWTPPRPAYTRAHAEEFVRVGAPRQWSEGTAAQLAVADAATGVAVGLVVLIDRGPRVCAAVGWWTLPSSRGRGVASRAARLVTHWAHDLGHPRLEAEVEVGNDVSVRVAERAGYVQEGVARGAARDAEGRPLDMVVLASVR